VTCYISLSKIDEIYAGIERDWPGIYHRKDFRSRILWNMLKAVPAARRREYFIDLEKRSVLAHELSHAEDLLRSPYADSREKNDADRVNGESKALLAGLRVSPFDLIMLSRVKKKEYLPIREKIPGAFTKYSDTPAEGDIASLPAADKIRYNKWALLKRDKKKTAWSGKGRPLRAWRTCSGRRGIYGKR